MSYSDQPALTGWQKLGCLLYAVFWIATIPLALPISGTTSHEVVRAMPAVVLLGGFVLLRFFMREKND